MYKIFFLLTFLIVPLSVLAEKLDVIADTPSGTYDTPVYITLTATEPQAKTFYSFKPDGHPNDAFLYTGSILLKHSSPFIYFSFLSTSNESKIKQNDYIIRYPTTIQFREETFSGSGKLAIELANNGAEAVNIGWWYVQSEIETVTIPKGTILASGEKYSMHINYAWNSSIVLRSPDDDERDILVYQNQTYIWDAITPKKKITVDTKRVPRVMISASGNTIINKASEVPLAILPTINTQTGLITTPMTQAMITPEGIEASKIPEITTPTISQIVKVSTAESGQKTTNPLYFIALLMISTVIGGFQWFIKRKQK